MTLEKILVGDNDLNFARSNFPFIPNAEVEFIADPKELIRKATSGSYSTIVTDLNYSEGGQEGFKVLEALRGVSARKILWTGNAYDAGVRERAQSFGAEVLDKDEIGALVGQVVSKAPLKESGKVLVYVPEGMVGKVLKQIVEIFFKPGEDRVVFSSDLRIELETGQYGLVIDTSTAQGDKRAHGRVAHDMKYMKLAEVPRVVPVHDLTRVVCDIARIAGGYLARQ